LAKVPEQLDVAGTGEGAMKIIKCRHCGAENDANAKTCDDCGKYLSGSQSVATHDHHWGRCAWESDGQRCCNAGTLADGTTGSDTWYCRGHYHLTDGAIGRLVVDASYRADPHPDFSLEARAAASRRAAEKAVPEHLRGWYVDEYREYCRSMLKTLKSNTKMP
jgi:hypothetical protein